MPEKDTGILDVCFLTWVSITSGEKEIVQSLITGEEEIGVAFSEVLNGTHEEKLPVKDNGKIRGSGRPS